MNHARREYDESEELLEEFYRELPQVFKETNSPLQRSLAALQSMQGRKAPGIKLKIFCFENPDSNLAWD